jgi:sulfatase maturation enzyme AslB (radical SAM superfamily)
MLRKRYRINKVAFTGGEPASKFDELKSAIIQVSKLLPKTDITINTNGINLYKFTEKLLKKISVIALSRHHYNDKENYRIFRTDRIPSFKNIKDFPNKKKIHMRCNLIKGFVDNKESLVKYIDYFSDIGITDFGFVPLFLLNDYCRDNFIPYEETGIDSLPNSRVVRSWTYDDCHCKNYIAYTEKGNLVKYYARSNREPGTCESTVVYDKDRLRVGFNGEVIEI